MIVTLNAPIKKTKNNSVAQSHKSVTLYLEQQSNAGGNPAYLGVGLFELYPYD
jgi:hypothetical protein